MDKKPFFNTAVIIGVGLIGGSVARVLKNRGMAKKVIGCGRSESNLAAALKLGIIDEVVPQELAVADADFIMLCPPVLSIIPTLRAIAPHIKKGALVTDGGSTKKDIVSQGETIAGGNFTFIGSHPIAGTEESGAASSFDTLFDNHKCVITPTPKTPKDQLDILSAFWRAAGCEVAIMDAAAHDHLLGAVSHLPHLAAYALVNTVCDLEKGEDLLAFAAGGFRDTTRIASSPAEMWADISLANAPALLEMSAALRAHLADMETAISAGDRDRLMSIFKRANDFRKKLPKLP